MSSVQNLNHIDFTKLSQTTTDTYLLDFWAPWCGPCKMMAPVLEWMADQAESKRFTIAKINTDENQELSSQMGIQGIPYFALIQFDGKGSYNLIMDVVGSQTNKQAFLDKINAAIDEHQNSTKTEINFEQI
ncbi:MAG: thioredoxin family protein [Candidatus Parcubacteria bacterium]|nr:thioredoxin family protein [Candidatus Paceibacterota bacterium]